MVVVMMTFDLGGLIRSSIIIIMLMVIGYGDVISCFINQSEDFKQTSSISTYLAPPNHRMSDDDQSQANTKSFMLTPANNDNHNWSVGSINNRINPLITNSLHNDNDNIRLLLPPMANRQPESRAERWSISASKLINDPDAFEPSLNSVMMRRRQDSSTNNSNNFDQSIPISTVSFDDDKKQQQATNKQQQFSINNEMVMSSNQQQETQQEEELPRNLEEARRALEVNLALQSKLINLLNKTSTTDQSPINHHHNHDINVIQENSDNNRKRSHYNDNHSYNRSPTSTSHLSRSDLRRRFPRPLANGLRYAPTLMPQIANNVVQHPAQSRSSGFMSASSFFKLPSINNNNNNHNQHPIGNPLNNQLPLPYNQPQNPNSLGSPLGESTSSQKLNELAIKWPLMQQQAPISSYYQPPQTSQDLALNPYLNQFNNNNPSSLIDFGNKAEASVQTNFDSDFDEYYRRQRFINPMSLGLEQASEEFDPNSYEDDGPQDFQNTWNLDTREHLSENNNDDRSLLSRYKIRQRQKKIRKPQSSSNGKSKSDQGDHSLYDDEDQQQASDSDSDQPLVKNSRRNNNNQRSRKTSTSIVNPKSSVSYNRESAIGDNLSKLFYHQGSPAADDPKNSINLGRHLLNYNYEPIGSSSYGGIQKSAALGLSYGSEMAPGAHHSVVHIHTKDHGKKNHGKYLWPIVGAGLTMLMGFLVISNILLSIPLLAIGASSLFNGGNQGGWHSQQLVPVYNLSSSGRRRRRKRWITKGQEFALPLIAQQQQNQSAHVTNYHLEPTLNVSIPQALGQLFTKANTHKINETTTHKEESEFKKGTLFNKSIVSILSGIFASTSSADLARDLDNRLDKIDIMARALREARAGVTRFLLPVITSWNRRQLLRAAYCFGSRPRFGNVANQGAGGSIAFRHPVASLLWPWWRGRPTAAAVASAGAAPASVTMG